MIQYFVIFARELTETPRGAEAEPSTKYIRPKICTEYALNPSLNQVAYLQALYSYLGLFR
jgi:hypothetical protein